jgi:hypothetical protein
MRVVPTKLTLIALAAASVQVAGAVTTVGLGTCVNLPIVFGGGAVVTYSTSDPTKVLLNDGQSTVNIFIPLSGAPRPMPQACAINPAAPGTVSVAEAVGGGFTVETVNVVSAVFFYPGTITISKNDQARPILFLSGPAKGPVTVNLTSTDTTVATVAASVTFPPGVTSVVVPVTPLKAGMVSIIASDGGSISMGVTVITFM